MQGRLHGCAPLPTSRKPIPCYSARVLYVAPNRLAPARSFHLLASATFNMSSSRRLPEPEKAIVQDARVPDRRLAQPFSGWNHQDMTASIDHFIQVSGLEDYDTYIRRGAFLAQSSAAFPVGRERRDGLTLKDNERHYLALENSSRLIDKFNQPWRLYALVGICSLGAAVQGW
jgi:hypothetical protein